MLSVDLTELAIKGRKLIHMETSCTNDLHPANGDAGNVSSNAGHQVGSHEDADAVVNTNSAFNPSKDEDPPCDAHEEGRETKQPLEVSPEPHPFVEPEARINVVEDKGSPGSSEQETVGGCNVTDGVAEQSASANEVSESAEVPAEGAVVKPKIEVKCGVGQLRCLPDKIVLPNLTLGREPAFVEHPLESTIVPDFVGRYETEECVVERTDMGLRFTPKKAGDPIRVRVQYNLSSICTFEMTVNPDPWSLWEVNQPGEDSIVFEQDRIRLENNHKNVIGDDLAHFKIFGASRRGRSHERSGSFRDDDMGYWADANTGRYLYVVADGAGSAKFSREGSRRAVEYVKAHVNEKLTEAAWAEDGVIPKKTGKIGHALMQLAYEAMASINAYVDGVVKSDPEKKWELRDFNTTLLMAAVNRSPDGSLRIVTFSIGDGAIATFDGERSELLCSPDGGEYSGGTYFLTTRSVWVKANNDPAAFYNARVHVKCVSAEDAKRLTLFLMTDGVSDPWFETDAGLENTVKWREFAEDTLMGSGNNKAHVDLNEDAMINAERLWEWLYFKIVGNHDDRTIIAVYPQTKNVQEVK